MPIKLPKPIFPRRNGVDYSKRRGIQTRHARGYLFSEHRLSSVGLSEFALDSSEDAKIGELPRRFDSTVYLIGGVGFSYRTPSVAYV